MKLPIASGKMTFPAKSIQIVHHAGATVSPFSVIRTEREGEPSRLNYKTADEARAAGRRMAKPGWTLTDTTPGAERSRLARKPRDRSPSAAAEKPRKPGIVASFAHLITGSRADAAPVAPEEMRSPADNAARIIAAGRRARGEIASPAPTKPTGLAAKILAAGRKARGEQ